jgi:hypothetical protein
MMMMMMSTCITQVSIQRMLIAHLKRKGDNNSNDRKERDTIQQSLVLGRQKNKF